MSPFLSIGNGVDGYLGSSGVGSERLGELGGDEVGTALRLYCAVTFADVVRASGVPGRTLFKHFKEYRGVSRMRYLRTARFQRVRSELRRLEPKSSVTDVAMRWGFEHMGRFAVEYCELFGESPSHTLGKRRPRGRPHWD